LILNEDSRTKIGPRNYSTVESPILSPKLSPKSQSAGGLTGRQAVALLIICAFALSQIGCLGPKRTPALDRIFAQARERKGKTPIIVIPGILGSELVDQKTGAVAWPSGGRSMAASLTLPLSPDLSSNRDNLYPRKIIASVKLARLVPEVYVYRGLLDALRQYGGYAEGDWNNPAAGGDQDTYYVFGYDWRRDNVESARELIQRMEALKRKLNRPDLKFNLVAHSMGGLISRYAAMYGDADLPVASAASPNWAGAAHINRIVMFGVPNEGSADAFATLLRGYSLTEGLRPQIRLFNTFSKEVAFSSPAVFQLLPHTGATHFLDEDLKPLQVNLYDIATWKLYEWESMTIAPRAKDETSGGQGATTMVNANAGRQEYLAAVLRRAQKFHEALDAPTSANPPVALLSFGGDCEHTLEAPVLRRDLKKGRWLTLTSPESYRTKDGRRISEKEAVAAMFVPGDGRVTRRSLLAEDLVGERRAGSLFNAGLPIAYSMFGCDLHGNLQNNPILQDNALTALISEVLR
jgi:pimeloyl-ACP methyl ester carboxylesterase